LKRPTEGHEIPSLSNAGWLCAREAQAVFECVEAGGFHVRAVGGVVRNALLGLPVEDVDLATDATPETVSQLALKAGLSVHPTGIEHGTVTVVSGHVAYEVTTLRRDVSTDGRRATVAFTTDWREDAMRRDFTINAIYCDREGRVFDPLGGYPDLADRKVRFIGSADERIREDYLRILRFFRFHAAFAGDRPIDGEGLSACVAHREGLPGLSRERVRSELLRMLAAPGAVPVTRTMAETGILGAILPVPVNGDWAGRLRQLARVSAIEATLRAASVDADIICADWRLIRLGAVAGLGEIRGGSEGDGGERPATPGSRVAGDDIADRLRLSNHERDVLDELSAFRMAIPIDADTAALRAAVYRRGKAALLRGVIWDWALGQSTTTDPERIATVRRICDVKPPRLPIGGKDVIARGIAPGPRIGQIVKAFETRWLEAGLTDDPSAIAELLDDTIAALDA